MCKDNTILLLHCVVFGLERTYHIEVVQSEPANMMWWFEKVRKNRLPYLKGTKFSCKWQREKQERFETDTEG